MTVDPVRTLRRTIAWLALGTATGVLSCDSHSRQAWRASSDLESVWPSPDGQLLITQLETGDVVAFDAESGATKWNYRHFGTAKHPIIEFPEPRLVCRPVHTTSNIVYLLFSDRLVSLSTETGHVRWRRRIHSPYARSMCPSAAPDSGLLIVVRRGRALAKIDPNGELDWTTTLPDRAVTHSGATVVQASGDILLRSGNHVLGFTPEGEPSFRQELGRD